MKTSVEVSHLSREHFALSFSLHFTWAVHLNGMAVLLKCPFVCFCVYVCVCVLKCSFARIKVAAFTLNSI